jgi:hypothetical protein
MGISFSINPAEILTAAAGLSSAAGSLARHVTDSRSATSQARSAIGSLASDLPSALRTFEDSECGASDELTQKLKGTGELVTKFATAVREGDQEAAGALAGD